MKERAKTEPAYGHLPTGLQGLDGALWGGIPFGIVTEVVGPAGIGKTQVLVKLLSVAVCIIMQAISLLRASQRHHDWVFVLLLEMQQKFSFGLLLSCNSFDRFLVGSLHVLISDFLQLCLMLSALTSMPEALGGLNSGVIYIDTEHKFTSGR